MMQTRRSTKSNQNINISGASPPRLDNINDLVSSVASIDDSLSPHTATEHDQPQSTLSPSGLTPSHSTDSIQPTTPSNRSSTPTTNVTSAYRSGSAISATTPIEQHFGLRPRGRNAIASFPNNIANINPANYIWVKGSSNYTLCHNAPGEPTQALLWLVGNIDSHTLEAATPYENWTVDIALSTDADKALDTLLETGPWKTFTKPNRYSILRTKATLGAVRDDLRDDDDEDLASLGQTITANDPFPFTYNGSMIVENGAVPNSRYDISNFGRQTSIAVEVSILGYQMKDKVPGYSFGLRGVYHLGNPLQSTTATPTKKRKGGCIISPRRRKTGAFNADSSRGN